MLVARKFSHRDIRLSVRIQASCERAWTAVTSARQLCSWWVDRAETNLRNSGRLRLVWTSFDGCKGKEWRGSFVDIEPGRKVAWLWDSATLPKRVPPLTTLFIESDKSVCRATLVHAGFPAGAAMDPSFNRCKQAWEDFLAKLALYLESGRTCKGQQITLAELEMLRKFPRQKRLSGARK